MSAVALAWALPLVALAGAAGAVARHLAVHVGGRFAAPGRAAAIAGCNLTGAALLGWLAALERSDRAGALLLLVVGSGFCGALTTFSSWIVEAVASVRDGQRLPRTVAIVDLAGQVVTGVGLVYVLVRLA